MEIRGKQFYPVEYRDWGLGFIVVLIILIDA